MNSFYFNIGRFFADKIREMLKSELSLCDDYEICSKLDPDKAYEFIGTSFGTEGFLPNRQVEFNASSKLFGVRMHEDCLPLSHINDFGMTLITNPNLDESIFLNPGDESVVITLVDLNKQPDISFSFVDSALEERTEEDVIDISIKDILADIMDQVNAPDRINTSYWLSLLHYDSHRLKMSYDRNEPVIRTYIDYVHINSEGNDGNPCYDDILLIYYRYITRLE